MSAKDHPTDLGIELDVFVLLLANDDAVPQMEVQHNHVLVLAGLIKGMLDIARRLNSVK